MVSPSLRDLLWRGGSARAAIGSHAPYLVEGVLLMHFGRCAQDAPALRIKEQFVAAMKDIEAKIEARNAAGTSVMRSRADGGLPYELLIPSSGKGVTGRGIPYSISI